jgi:hypothetical protein
MSVIINDLSNICLQRSRRQLYNIPLPRFNLTSPYTGSYTANDYNMRRKAEILKYNNNASSTKTNNSTKKELFSQLVNNTHIASLTTNTKCVVDTCGNLILRSTSASNVPGKIQYLYDDERVPLYNYGNFLQNRSYPYQMPNNIVPWYIYTSNDILNSSTSSAITYNTDGYIQSTINPTTTENTLFSIYILNNINKEKYAYTITTPISVNISGYTSISTTMSMTINAANINVYYNSTIVYSTIVNMHYGFTLNLTSNKTYTSNVYIGLLTFTIPELLTKPGYIYDIKISFTFPTVVLSNNANGGPNDTMNISGYMNTSQTRESFTNCSISSYTAPTYSSFSISGV